MRFRFSWLLALGLTFAASAASALTLTVVGGPGLDQGTVCTTGSLSCFDESSAAYVLAADAPISGSVDYDSVGGTVDINITLASAALFPGSGAGGALVSLLAGSQFVVTDVPVIQIPLGGGAYQLVLGGAPAASSATLSYTQSVAPLGPLAAAPSGFAVSGLTCTVGTGSDQCGFSFGPSALAIDLGAASAPDHDLLLTFNVTVPESGTLALCAAGLASLGLASRRRD